MEKIKLLEINSFYPEHFNGKMVGYVGAIEDSNCSSTKRTVLFLCNPDGTNISVRVPNTRILFVFCDHDLNVKELKANLIIDVESNHIEAGREYENYLTLIDVNK